MTKVNDLGTKPAFNVHTKDVVKGVQPSPQISTEIISKSKIGIVDNPSLASKKVKTQAKSENNTQTLWKVAAVVMLAVSSIFLGQFARMDAAIVKNPLNPFANPICLAGDEKLGEICYINDLVQSKADAVLRHIPNPFADPTCLIGDEKLGKICYVNDTAPSRVDAALRHIPNPFGNAICLKTDENICQVNDQVKIVTENNPFKPICPNFGNDSRTKCFNENDLEEMVICSHKNDKFSVKIAAKDKSIIDDFSKKYRLTLSECFPFVGISGDRAKAIIASSALAEDFVNAGKYDEALLVIHQANPNAVLRMKFLEIPVIEKLLSLLKSIAIKSNTFSIQLLALEKMHSVGELYPEIRQSIWNIRFSVSEELFKRGLLGESLHLLTEMYDKNNLNAERSLAQKIAIASTDENVRLKALSHKKY